MIVAAPERLLHLAVAVVAVLALLLNGIQQDGSVSTNLLASLFLTGIVTTDTLTRKIPNVLVLATILLGLAVNGQAHAIQGLAASLAGISVGLVLLFPFYLAGGMGAGDVKAFAALGSLLGPASLLQIFLYTALIGGVLSLLHFCCTCNLRQQSRAFLITLRALPYSVNFKSLAPEDRKRQQLPYAAAIAFGFFAFHHWGPIIPLPW